MIVSCHDYESGPIKQLLQMALQWSKCHTIIMPSGTACGNVQHLHVHARIPWSSSGPEKVETGSMWVVQEGAGRDE